ncbi:MAG: ABC transporter permease [Enhydrobacter sp.]|nr:ABC transporter permease [Enhydrobacter sp.]
MIAATRSSWIAIGNWVFVIWALMPQILTRFARGSKLALFVYFFEPLIMVCMFYAIRGLLKQNTPNYGTSLFLFYASGFLPYFLFMRMSTRTRTTNASPNSVLPGASGLDAYIATAALGALMHIAMMVLVFYGMWLYGISEARPVSIVECAKPLLLFIILGVGIGMINNVINRYMPFWHTLYKVMTRGMIFLSGVVIIVDLTPIWLRAIVVANPLSHGIEWFRHGVYGRYPINSLDESYLIEWALVTLFLGFVISRATIRQSERR